MCVFCWWINSNSSRAVVSVCLTGNRRQTSERTFSIDYSSVHLFLLSSCFCTFLLKFTHLLFYSAALLVNPAPPGAPEDTGPPIGPTWARKIHTDPPERIHSHLTSVRLVCKLDCVSLLWTPAKSKKQPKQNLKVMMKETWNVKHRQPCFLFRVKISQFR